MRIDIMTLFPDSLRSVLNESIIGRAVSQGTIEIYCHQIRDYTENRQMQVDDYPYGGGWGCVMMAQPLHSCLDAVLRQGDTPRARRRVIYTSPQGTVFSQETAKRLVRDYDRLILVCGHYEGVDERFIEECVDEEISLGDFVLTGGEIPAMAICDAVCRLVPGVLADSECYTEESHWEGLLEYPQYTRPEVWHGRSVPQILTSGRHGDIGRWRRKQSLLRTMERRPDLFGKFSFDDHPVDRAILAEIEAESAPPSPPVPDFGCRRATVQDMQSIMYFVKCAKEVLRQRGVDQWQEDYPAEEDFLPDIEREECWLFTADDVPAGVVTLSLIPEPCYDDIDGAWLSEGKYLVIHRLALAAEYRGSGLSDEIIAFARDLALGKGCASVRIDTHRDNVAMHRLLARQGFALCGEVDYRPENPGAMIRVAYEAVLD